MYDEKDYDEKLRLCEKEMDEQLKSIKMESNSKMQDFERFSEKVQTITNLIQDLSSDDFEKSKKAMMKADLFLRDLNYGKNIDVKNCKLKEKTNRTVINQAAFDAIKDEGEKESNVMDQQAFMKSVEVDAKNRFEDRKQRKEISDKYKFEGNKAFRNQDYEKAVECFNKAIAATKDSALLFNNRALTYLKLGLNKRALEDAEAALVRSKNNVKGIIYKAHALYNLARFDESNETIQKACEEMPNKVSIFKDAQYTWLPKKTEN